MSSIDALFAESLLRKYPDAKKELAPFLQSLFQAAVEGHLCLYSEEEISAPKELFENELRKEENRYYLKRFWECEKSFLKHLERISVPSCTQIENVSLDQENISEEQKKAILHALKNPLTLITGGPGTGKTRTASILLKHIKGNVALAAPTGKAAANLRLATGISASTLHSLLQKNLHDIDLFIIDEASMIDAELMLKLFSKVKTGARLVLLGDAAQLPPVESGNLFEAILKRKDLVCELTHCYRAELKEIIELATLVKNGQIIPYQNLPERKILIEEIGKRFEFKKGLLPEQLLTELKRFRVLTALRTGSFGAEELNHAIASKRRDFHPIMITENDPETELFNGDLGVIIEKLAYFESGKSVPVAHLPAYEWAYCSTIHKSQGSEYDEVIILLPQGSHRFGREILYTAITRARKSVTIYSVKGVIEEMVVRRTARLTGI